MRSLTLAALAAVCLSSVSAVAAPSDAGRLTFEVTRNGHPFGRHTVVVSAAGDELRAQSNVSLEANVGPLTVYRLEQACTEHWRAGVLARLNCSTLKEGRRVQIHGELQDGRLRVSGPEGAFLFPAGAFPTSWWTMPPAGQTTMIDTQTGEAMPVRVTHLGAGTAMIGGQSTPVQRVRVVGTLTLDLLYDSQGRWVGCSFSAHGQNVEYRLSTPLSAAPA